MGKRMALLQPIKVNILCICMWAAVASTQENQAQTISPNCPSRCGSVNIPYPFGVGEGCYRDKAFEIVCNNTDSVLTSTPFLGLSRYEVSFIVIRSEIVQGRLGNIGVLIPYKRCDKNVSAGRGIFFDFTDTPFTLSTTDNMLVAVGCDVFVRITDLKSQNFVTGCVSLCPNDNTRRGVSDHSCSGIGCCQTPIPMGLKAFNITLETISTQSRSSASNSDNCNYAVVNQFGVGVANSRVQVLSSPTYLDWAIGNETCKEAKKNSTSYACRDKNSNCTESVNGIGYLCNCNNGYYGNPYLTNGCKVGGCSDCVKDAFCFTLGYKIQCSCLSGWTGDGRKDGSGCTSNRIRYILIGVGAGGGLLVLLAVFLFLLCKKLIKRRQTLLKENFFKQNGGLLLKQQISSGEGNIDKIKVFVAEELEKATDNFNESRILGRGGSGTVYKGMLSDGRIVAVKKSKIVDESQIGQFINELVILSRINHRHVVQLFGCCLETEVPLLVYEFVSNGTLAHHLHDEECKASISWDNRLRIATEIAGAISYMHSSATTPIFHRDIKCSNILLDENFKTKVSDFGISRSVSYENTHLTTLVQGTFGYLDPEYFHSGQFTDKSDVYSFGIVLVEFLTGQKPISSTRPEEEKNLAMHFISSVKENYVLEILETRVKDEGRKEELLVVAKLAKRCLKLVGKKRPTMREVLTELERLRHVEERQGIAQCHKDANRQDNTYCRYDSSTISISSPLSEDTQMIWEGGR